MVRKFFLTDKNYLLEEAQLALREDLIASLLTLVKEEYQLRYNPLGLSDLFIENLKSYEGDRNSLEAFYDTLAGVYRYKFGDNQLEFSWDGIDHSEKYKKEWSEFFHNQVSTFCRNELFIKAVLDLTVFNGMNNFILRTFEVKISKGFIKVA
ncbi:MAG: hypothetical protein WDO15_15480 [Bacteroidota bacterium]